jgi:ABC-type phosphate transport system substrate-binding protein
MKKITQAFILAAIFSIATASSMAEVVVVVNSKNSASSMTSEQVSQFFLGKSVTLTPLDQAEGSAIRSEFYKKVADKDSAQVKTIWSKLIFTGKGSLPKEFASSADVKKALAANPNAIGYIEKSAVDTSVKVVATLP